jgi:hypothetical protein
VVEGQGLEDTEKEGMVFSHADVYQSHKCSTALCSDPLYHISTELDNKGGI